MTDLERILYKGISYIKKIWKLSSDLSRTTSCSTIYYFIDCIYCYINYGCYIEWYFDYFYRLSKPIRRNTLTHNKFKEIYKKHNQANSLIIFNNKVLFNRTFKEYQYHDSLYLRECTKVEFLSFINKHNTFLLKPIDEMQGKGIKKYTISDEENIDVLFELWKIENFLIEEIVKPHPKIIFNNKALNTVRIYTILNSNLEVNIAGTFIRCGIGESIVDNFSAGGVLYNIDIETGIILSKGFNFKGQYLYHPGSSIKMVGYQIPYWNQVIDYVKQLAMVVPQCKIVGWDIAITEKGIDIIEGNCDPGHRLLEIFQRDGMFNKILDMLK